MTIEELVKDAYGNSKAHGFHENEDREKSIPEKLVLIHAEVSEALEHYRTRNADYEGVTHGLDEVWFDGKGKPDGFAVELADVVIRIGDLCGQLGIDLTHAVMQKMAYNKTRPYKHGKCC